MGCFRDFSVMSSPHLTVVGGYAMPSSGLPAGFMGGATACAGLCLGAVADSS